jgi:hypothetical protein
VKTQTPAPASGGPGVQSIAKLKTRDGRLVECLCTFTSEEWQRLLRFAQLADELRQTKLVAAPGALRWTQNVDNEGTVDFRVLEAPTPDEFRALLHLMRPFILSDEPTNFGRVRNILAKQLRDPDFQRYLEREAARFTGAIAGRIRFISDGVVLNSDETLRKWLNAYEYHRDHEKAQELEALHDGFMPMEMTRMHMIELVLDKTRAVLELLNAIRSIECNSNIEPFLER